MPGAKEISAFKTVELCVIEITIKEKRLKKAENVWYNKEKSAKKRKETMEIEEYLRSIDKKYYVPDCGNSDNDADIEFLFIVESPHTSEIDSKKPLSGQSGHDINNFFGIDDDKPFGILVSENSKKITSKVKIINVSNVPLQIIPGTNDCLDIEDRLKTIRNQEKINGVLEKNLQEKLDVFISNKNLTIVICGDFAKRYFDDYIEKPNKGKEMNKKITALYVPHPSRHQWIFIDKHKENLDKLKRKFNKKCFIK